MMGLIALGIMFAVMASALLGIGNAWERNIRNGAPKKSRQDFLSDAGDRDE
jgi:hypothetical protein